MAFYGKVFTIEKEENFEDLIKAIGVPEERAQKMRQFKPTQKIDKNGDSYTLTINTIIGEKITSFKPDEEFSNTFADMKAKITVSVNGNKFTHTINLENGSKLTVVKEYTDNTFEEEITHSKWNGVARRYYKAQ